MNFFVFGSGTVGFVGIWKMRSFVVHPRFSDTSATWTHLRGALAEILAINHIE
jgi:hypothetical protein